MVQANSRQPNPTFDKLQLRIATRYGFTVLPVLNEAEAAKVLGKMVGEREAAVKASIFRRDL